MSGGFVDLRLNRRNGNAEESFWPSFTDIMTVVVLVFLLAMVVLLIQNIDLVDRLRATMEAERQASQLAQAVGDEKASLAVRLDQAESQVSMLRMELMRLSEEGTRVRGALLERETQLAGAEQERTRLQTRVQGLERGLEEAAGRLDSAALEISGLRSERSRLQGERQAAREELAALALAHEQQQRQLFEARSEAEQARQRIVQAQGEYAELRAKYEELIKPARSSEGKAVVEVRYDKPRGDERILIRRPEDSAFSPIDRTRMHEVLTTLKRQHADSLYVKVIFPEDSGLTYNEAWTFTNELLSRYDYYYQ